MKATSAVWSTIHTIGVGIDTARYGHRAMFLRDDRQPAAKPLTVTENRQGYQQLEDRLQELAQQHPQAQFRVHIDAAGQYATNLERFLHGLKLPLVISVGEPKRNKDYHRALFPKQTTDDTESMAMARFALAEQPAAVISVPEEYQLLREVAGRLQAAIKDTTRVQNRLHNLLARVFPELAMKVNDIGAGWVLQLLKKYPTPKRLASSSLVALQRIPYLKEAEQLYAAAKTSVGSLKGPLAEALIQQQVEQLRACQQSVQFLENLLLAAYQALPRSGHVQVETIPGIGKRTAAVMVAKMTSINRFATPENLVGYFGIFPEMNTSGVNRAGKSHPPGTMHMSAKGADLVRRYLWNAAKSAIRYNAAVRELYARLRARGTRGDVALGHCMRKLLHQVFAVWASDQPYSEVAALHRKERPADSTPTVDAIATPEANESPAPKPETTMAAGHKREYPQSKVVTAANSSVAHPAESVKNGVSARGSIDYAYLREQIDLEQVLRHLGYLDRLQGNSAQRTGPCPFHQSQRQDSRSFSVNFDKCVFRCSNPACQAQGNALDLWAKAHNLPLYEAAQNLAETFRLQTQRFREEATRSPVFRTT